MPGRSRTPLCLVLCAGVAATACLSAPERADGGDTAPCGTSDALHDEFDGTGTTPPLWSPIYQPQYFRRVDGRLRFDVPEEAVTVILRSRMAFRLEEGHPLRVDVAAWPTTLGAYVMLDGVTQDFTFLAMDGFLDAVAALGTIDRVPLDGIRAVRFLLEEGLLHMQASSDPDGGLWDDIVFEPWDGGLATLRLMVLAEVGVSGETWDLESVNGDVASPAPWCSAAELAAPFEDPAVTVFDVDTAACWTVDGGLLVLGAGCYATTAEAFSLEDAAVAVALPEAGPEVGELALAAVLRDGTERTAVWTPSGARLDAPGGVVATSDVKSDRLRLVHRDGELHAQQWVGEAWAEFGAVAVDDDLVREAQIELSASSDSDFRIEDLAGSPADE